MKQISMFFAIACATALCANMAHASLINVDFGTNNYVANDNTTPYGDTSSTTYTGAAVVGLSTDKWNGTTATSGNMALIDSTGASSGVTMAYTGGYMYCCGGGCSFGASTNQYRNLMDDYLIPSGGDGVAATATNFITLSGLAAGTYNLYIYSAADKKDRVATFTAGTKLGSSSVTIGPNARFADDFEAGVTYGIIQVTVGDNGTLTLSASKTSTGGSEIDINGFQLQSVPEPASITLLVTGAIGLLAYAWRKRHSS